MVDPINYMAQLPQPDFADAIGRGLAVGQNFQQNRNVLEKQRLANDQAEALFQQQQARQQQKQIEIQRALQSPTAENFARLQTLFPEDREAFKSAWETKDIAAQKADLREMGGIFAALKNDRADIAEQTLTRRIAADKAAGQDTSDDEMILDAVRKNPAQAAGIVGYSLSNIVDPKDFGATFGAVGKEVREQELQPGAVRKGLAEAATAETTAEFAPRVAESALATEEAARVEKAARVKLETDRLALDWDKLALDKDALTTNTQLKLEELTQGKNKIEGASLTELTSAVGSAQQNLALQDRASKLADDIAASDLRGAGWRSWLGEKYAGSFGTQDAVSALRSQYQQLINSQAVKNLPPGPASDKDIAVAKQGFPPADAGKDYMVSFLRGMSKMQGAAAAADDRKANWISANQNLGTAKRDLDVGGVRVPAGTTFGEFERNQRKFEKIGAPPARGYLEKYGK